MFGFIDHSSNKPFKKGSEELLVYNVQSAHRIGFCAVADRAVGKSFKFLNLVKYTNDYSLWQFQVVRLVF
jgi:hypothetical protein